MATKACIHCSGEYKTNHPTRAKFCSLACWGKSKTAKAAAQPKKKQPHSEWKNRPPLYGVWHAMKMRCTNSKHKAYRRYGGRGITVCDRWLTSYQNFESDMGPRPVGTQIDRIDNDGNYEPTNCRWVTVKVNARNRPRTWDEHVVDGVLDSIQGHALRLGIAPQVVYYRMKRLGLPLESALKTPSAKGNRKRHLVSGLMNKEEAP